MESSRPYEDGMKTKQKPVDMDLLKKLSAKGIKITPSLLKFCKRFGVFLSLLFVCNFVSAQTELKSFSANFTGSKVKLCWNTSSENNANYFILERSWNGKNFEPVGLIKTTGSSSRQTDYTFVDKDYYDNIIYYRLKITADNRNETLLGGIIAVQMKEDVKSFSIYPFSNIPNTVYVDVSRVNSDKIIVDATDADGQKLASKQLDKTQNELTVELKSAYVLQHGDYTITAFYDNHVLKSKLSIHDSSMNLSENISSGKNQALTLK